MDGWDDIDAITADLDNVLSGFDIPGEEANAPAAAKAAAAFNAAPPAAKSPPLGGSRLDSSKKKKVPSTPGHASQFGAQAKSPPMSQSRPKPAINMPASKKGPRPVARGAAAPTGGAVSKSPFKSQAPAAGENEYTNQAPAAAEEEYNVLDGNGSPDYGFDDRFGPGSVWFHGKKKRALCEALIKKGPNGTYLVRESTTSRGDYVLSCKESDRMSHYIITSKNGRVTIGDRHFGSIPLLVKNYQTNILETTKLLYPVDFRTDEPRMGDTSMSEKKAKALFNFAGDDDEDLAFSKGDHLTIIDQSEPNWWRARDSKGNVGVIPHNYVEILKDGAAPAPSSGGPPVPSSARPNARKNSTDTLPGMDVPPMKRAGSGNNVISGVSPTNNAARMMGGGATFGVNARNRTGSMKRINTSESLEGLDSLKAAPGAGLQSVPDVVETSGGGGETVKAIMTCHPNAYDPSALSFKKGDTVTILKKDSSGTWEGEANGKRGHFPCSYVE